MSVDKETLLKMAHLSRLHLAPGTEDQMLSSMNALVDWVAKLSEVDTEGVAPLTHVTERFNSLREDEVRNQLPREQALSNVPQQDGVFLRVPKVVDK
jgi:aspartyl-tRNA(Asn)/glutamyl-tRNA(Gln) amidotransferase subunit C